MTVEEIARTYLGLKEDKNNRFEKDSLLGQILHKAGQKDGEPWCCYFQEGIFCKAFPHKDAELRKLFSANCVETFYNFLRSRKYKVVSYPVPGALVIWQNVKGGVIQMTGHAGLCVRAISRTQFNSIEGNTNEAGSREGVMVAEKLLRSTARTENGLNVLGFIIIQ